MVRLATGKGQTTTMVFWKAFLSSELPFRSSFSYGGGSGCNRRTSKQRTPEGENRDSLLTRDPMHQVPNLLDGGLLEE
jgi:hypothetical protein